MTIPRRCERCGGEMSKPYKYSARQWAERKFCSATCHNPVPAVCAAAACESPARGAHGFCNLHRQRVAKHGDPEHARWPAVVERVMARVRFGDCWEWTGSVGPKTGYGQVWADGKNRLAHRLVYELLVGEVPAGLELDHLCRNRICVNPAHLEPVTSTENNRRMHAARRTRPMALEGVRQS